jgi:hypothetical protein
MKLEIRKEFNLEQKVEDEKMKKLEKELEDIDISSK